MPNTPTSGTDLSKGILTFAFGKRYQVQAYCQALTAKRMGLPMTVVVSHDEDVESKLKDVAEVVRIDGSWSKFEYEQFAYDLSPYDITFKTDADMLFPLDCSLYHSVGIGISSGVACSVDGRVSDSVQYRKSESQANIPTIYSALFSFERNSEQTREFFKFVKYLFHNWYRLKIWDVVEKIPPTTDSVYSLAWTRVYGAVRIDGNKFIHAKPGINHWTTENWVEDHRFHVDPDGSMYFEGLKINLPFHYFDKSLITDKFINRIEDVCNI